MFSAMNEVTNMLDELNLKYKITVDNDELNAINLTMTGKVAGTYKIDIILADDSNSLMFKSYAARVPAEKTEAMYEEINKLHNEYRFFAFFLDKDNDFTIEFDFLNALGNVREAAGECLIRINNIVNDVYPRIMKVIWS